jgi:hypothetical protein
MPHLHTPLLTLALILLLSCGGGGIGGNAPAEIKQSFQRQIDQTVEATELMGSLVGATGVRVTVRAVTVNTEPDGSYVGRATLTIFADGEPDTVAPSIYRYDGTTDTWMLE